MKKKMKVLNAENSKKKGKVSKKLSKRVLIAVLIAAVLVVGGIILGAFFMNSDKVLEDESSTQELELISAVNYTGGFPVSYNSSDIIDIRSFSSRIFVISKRLLTCFTASGKIAFAHNFSFKEPVIEAGEKYGIVYDRGASEFIVFNHKGIISEGKTEGSIICAQINNNGDVVFAVKGNNAACDVFHYDKLAKKIFGWSCADEYIVSVDLDNDATHFTAGAIGAEDGSIYSVVYAIDRENNDRISSCRLEGKSVVNISLTGSDLSVLCTDSRYVFSLKDAEFKPETTTFDQEITLFDTDLNGNCAVLSDSFSASGDNKITLYNKKNEITYVGLTKENVREILCYGKKVYLLTEDGVYISVSDGSFKKITETVFDGYRLFICKKKLYYYSDDVIGHCK